MRRACPGRCDVVPVGERHSTATRLPLDKRARHDDTALARSSPLSSIASSLPKPETPARRAAPRVASPCPCATATSRSQRCDTAMPIAARCEPSGIIEIVGADASGHVGDIARLRPAARGTKRSLIRSRSATRSTSSSSATPRVAIAEAELRPHIDLDVAAAGDAAAAEGAAGRPAVARKRPGDLAPGLVARRRHLVGRDAGERAERQRQRPR